MAKVKINWPPMSMKAEGEDAAVLAQAEQFLKYVKEEHKISFDVLPAFFRDGCRNPEELDDEDDEDDEDIKGMDMDGMPHGTTPGDSTASLAVKLADSSEEYKRTENRLLVRRGVLLADRDNIRDQLDRMNGDYKIILRGRYVYTQKSLQRGWTSIAAELGVKEITAQRKEKVALAILGPMLDEMPMAEEILLRAYDARD